MPQAASGTDMIRTAILASQNPEATLASELGERGGTSENEDRGDQSTEAVGSISSPTDVLQQAAAGNVDVQLGGLEGARSASGEESSFRSGNGERGSVSIVSPRSDETDVGSSTTVACSATGSSGGETDGGGTVAERKSCGSGEPQREDDEGGEDNRKGKELAQAPGASVTMVRDRSSAASSSGTGGSSIASTSEAPRRVVEVSHPPTGVMSVCGRRREMEDTFAVAHNFLSLSCELVGGCTGGCPATGVSRDCEDNSPALHFFGVYDGHGGAQVANFCRDHFHRALAEEVRVVFGVDNPGSSSSANTSANSSPGSASGSWTQQWEKAMNACFLRVDAEIEGVYRQGEQCGREGNSGCCTEPIAPETVGSTAVVAVVGSCQIIVANCGDSRAVLSRGGRAIALSVDHKPEREDELVRIESAGGKVFCWNGYRVFGVLAMSRAIGDRYLKPFVIADPEITCMQRSEDDECLILASDGLWDVLTNDEACEVARRRLAGRGNRNAAAGPSVSRTSEENAEAAAALLTKVALAQGSNDNISVVVVDLKNRNMP